jgi:hypothetical protein
MLGHDVRHLGGWLLVVGMILAAVGCATALAARQVTSLQQVAGTWGGTATGPRGTLSIKNDRQARRDLGVRPRGGNPPRHTGTVQLVDGKLRARSATTGNASTWTLYEGDGKRVLRIVNDSGDASAELTPAK